MRPIVSGGLAAAAFGTALMAASVLPVSAQVARSQSAAAIGDKSNELLTLVQNRNRGGGRRAGARAGRGSGGRDIGMRARSRDRVSISRASRNNSVRVARSHRVDRDRRRWNNNRRWSNWRWRHRHSYWAGGYRPYWGSGYWPYWGSGVAVGIGIGAPYYAYAYSPRYRFRGDAVAYCMRRFRSYDPVSGTYLGYDGLRHPCP